MDKAYKGTCLIYLLNLVCLGPIGILGFNALFFPVLIATSFLLSLIVIIRVVSEKKWSRLYSIPIIYLMGASYFALPGTYIIGLIATPLIFIMGIIIIIRKQTDKSFIFFSILYCIHLALYLLSME